VVFPGLVQPFIENAIWHGIRGLEDRKGFISIEFSFSVDNILRCIIKDDGIGRNLSRIRKNEQNLKKSRGIEIVEERIRIVNNLRKTNYKLRIEDLNPERDETGTVVIIELPFKLKIKL